MFTSDVQILKLVEILKDLGVITFDKEFCDAIKMSKQHFQNIKRQQNNPEEQKQNYHFTVVQVQAVCKVYGADANWILGFSQKPFRKSPVKTV